MIATSVEPLVFQFMTPHISDERPERFDVTAPRRGGVRELAAGECACTCVTPESHASGAFTIQDAVDGVFASGSGPFARLFDAAVSGNFIRGAGDQSAVKLLTPNGECTFNDNQVQFGGPIATNPNAPPPEYAVSLKGDSFVVCGNRITGSGGSLNIDTEILPFNTVLANITENVVRWKRLAVNFDILNQVRLVDPGGGGELRPASDCESSTLDAGRA